MEASGFFVSESGDRMRRTTYIWKRGSLGKRGDYILRGRIARIPSDGKKTDSPAEEVVNCLWMLCTVRPDIEKDKQFSS